ncbi:MAG TPA: protein kinase [Blastocatellia bacterium]
MVADAISHYRIVRKLGAGGMGEVYLAEDTKLNRRVAIKLLQQDLIGDEDARKRLVQEAQAAASLDHPNICAIHEVGEAEGQCFIVMQFVEGEMLAERVNAGLTLEQTLDVAIQIADALSEAHSRGIVHRDLKPQNIMISTSGRVKVLDFGLAKFSRPDALLDSQAGTMALTAPGVLIGTIPYMSPEQLEGKPADSRSDVFSVGVILFEMVTGRHPFVGDTAATIAANILMRDPPNVFELAPHTPLELQRIISKALAKSREARYQSAIELLLDLRDLRRNIELNADSISRQAMASFRSAASSINTGQVAERLTESLGQMPTGEVAARLRAMIFRPKIAIPLAAIIIITVAAAVALRSTKSPTNRTINSLAVLPFTEANPDPDSEYLSDGLTEGLITSLSQLPRLKVIASTSVFRYRGQEIDPRQVGRALGVEAIVTGRMVRRGDSLAITVELVDTQDNSRIWGDTLTKKVSEVSTIASSLSVQISNRLQPKAGSETQSQASRRQTDNPEAYRYYLQGRYYWNRRMGGALKKAIENFQKAAEIDPSYALAWAGIAESWVLGGGASLPPSEYIFKTREAVERALKLDDSLPEAHAALAKLKANFEWDWEGAEREFKKTLELDPNYAGAYAWYAEYLMTMRRLDEAAAMLKRAYELDPLSLDINTSLGDPLLYAGDYDGAIAAYKKALEIDANFLVAHHKLAIAYEMKGVHEAAESECQNVLSVATRYYPALALLGYSYARAGRMADARKVLDQLMDISRKGHISTFNMVVIYAGLGDADQALDWLSKAHEARDSNLVDYGMVPVIASLKSHPRFRDLLRKMKLPQPQ